MLHAARLFRAFAVVSSPHARPTRRRPTALARWAPFGSSSRIPRVSASMSTAAEDDPALTARKKTTRAEVKAALKALTQEEMASQSAAIATHLLAQLSCFDPDAARNRSATDRPLRLGLYVHCARLREVDTSALLVAALALPRAEVYVPVVDMPDPAAARAPPSMRFLQITSLEADLEPKTMGILEPTESLPDGAPRPNLETHATDGPLDVLLMPGLAFERTGARLGRGGGFYDAFLERYKRKCEDAGWQTPPAVALAFDVQILEEGKVPVGSSDRNVDALVTARHGVLVCTPAGARAAKPGK